MKTRINPLKKTILFLVLLLCFYAAYAQNSEVPVRSAIESRKFVFDAQTVLPNAARARQISGEGYEVRVSGDSLVSYLPYFGRVYSAPLNGEGGIKFTSTKFDYAVKNRKRGGWEIELQPNDITDVRKLVLTVFENGSATLRAMSNNRQPISFNGTVRAAL
jgi:hypothetical protein